METFYIVCVSMYVCMYVCMYVLVCVCGVFLPHTVLHNTSTTCLVN